ncbi:NAD(P)/FAD-dependent oxidoreductase [Propionispora hippei]|uniref:L-2-hydroxyglutarate oxidase LhgO n=1 Tax=Propionispora hippei DSM 15287 TaxID=1123003 RepID=A0A1M6HYZ7_9FIRM|nr:NAD(P)/FAD-dependent oxidoreductase [Propionispora hippei]SHJ27304.1 L-2-hydroxyglutarate oxidase LhgO [Propionispora hippei DSM 15287]
MDQVDVIVVGAGVVGLAVACRLAQRWPEKSILLLEKNRTFGLDMSARTSEVIHSGLYYPPGSFKARLCVSGKEKLYDFCTAWQVPHQRLGKLVIARNDEEAAKLDQLQEQALANGIADVTRLEPAAVARLEPNISCQAALFSPSSGIVDTRTLLARLEQVGRKYGAMPVYQQTVTAITCGADGYCVTYTDAVGRSDEVGCRCIVNAAGLGADAVAAMAGIAVDQAGYRIYRCKGEYFSVANEKAGLVSHLVFPASIRELKGSGIPVIKDMGGRLRLGPDAHYAANGLTDYRISPANARQFLAVVGSYLPFLKEDDLSADIAALRCRLLVACGSPPRDFVICHETERDLPGFVNLIGIESPGLTCCLSIADLTGDMLTPLLDG